MSTAVEIRFMRNDVLPSLYFQWPRCDHCGDEVEIDDGVASCSNCLIMWGSLDEEAESYPDPDLDGTEVQCEIVEGNGRRPYVADDGRCWSFGPPQPCILPSGHKGDHRCPYETRVTVVKEHLR